MSDEPLRTTTFTLTTADALAYTQASARMTPLGVLALLLWLGLWGAAALFIPADWAGPRLSWSSTLLASILIAIAYVLALLLIAFRQWLHARRLIRRPVEVTLTEWPDRLDMNSTGMPQSLAYIDIRRAIMTRTHLLLEADEAVLILPRRGFPEEAALDELDQRIAAAPKPQPVDPDRASA